MIRYTRIAVTIAVLTVGSILPLYAFSPAELDAPIYKDLTLWEERGYIRNLPHIRPYPIQLLKQLLTSISANPEVSQEDRTKAERYLRRMLPEKPVYLHSTADIRFSLGDAQEFKSTVGIGGGFSVLFHPIVSFTGVINPYFVDQGDGNALPYGYREPRDWVDSGSDITVFGRHIIIPTRVISHLSVGSPTIYAMAGISRASFGPFHDDSAVISRQAPYGGHFQFTYRTDRLSFQVLYRPLTASNDNGKGLYPGKHMIFHSLHYSPAKWITLGFFESVVWGERFEPLYFVPFISFFTSQALVGFEDNSFIGISALFRPIKALSIPVLLYVDDIHFNDIVSLEFNTKYKLSLQGGVRWYPDFKFLESLSLIYLAVMPYMYTHWDERKQPPDPVGINYSNYTHMGSNIGPSLPPNSDRLSLDYRVEPLPDLTVDVRGRMVRHGNASEGIIPWGDGSLFDPGYYGGKPTFQRPFDELDGRPYTRFLTQDIVEVHWQAGMSVGYSLYFDEIGDVSGNSDSAAPALRLSAEYLFDYVLNEDLHPDRRTSYHYVGFTAEFRW